MRIPLFDIDGTLIIGDKSFNIHDDAFFHAFETVYGLKTPKTESWFGKIDNQIVAETMVLNGISEITAKRKLKRAIQAMRDYFKKHEDVGIFKTLSGVTELLSELKRKNIPAGILSGNVELIAWGKLKIAGIDNFFQFGAFGDQADKRVDLIPIARKQAENFLKQKIKKTQLVIIGDTPLDIACAMAGGIESIGVASGIYSEKELINAGATLVITSLEEKDKILEFLQVK